MSKDRYLANTLLGFCLGLSVTSCSDPDTSDENCYIATQTNLPDGLRGLSSIRDDNDIYIWAVDDSQEQSSNVDYVYHLLRINSESGLSNIESLTQISLEGNPLLGVSYTINPLLVDETTLYFSADSSESGDELWSWPIDGSDVPRQLFDINPGRFGSEIAWMRKHGNTFFLSANNGTQGPELHAWNGDPDILPFLVKDLDGRSWGSAPESPLLVNNELWFTADTSDFGREWWRYNIDGMSDPALVSDINPGANSAIRDISGSPTQGILHEGIVYFSARDADAINSIEVEPRLRSLNPNNTTEALLVTGSNDDSTSPRNPEQFISTADGLYFLGDVDELTLLKPNGEIVKLAQLLNATELVKVGDTFYFNNRSTGILLPASNSIRSYRSGDTRPKIADSTSGYERAGMYEFNGSLLYIEDNTIRTLDRKNRCG